MDPARQNGEIEASKTFPTRMSRLTGDRVTYKTYNEGSTVTVRDIFLTLANTRPRDPKEWKGRVGLKLPQLRHAKKSERSRVGKP